MIFFRLSRYFAVATSGVLSILLSGCATGWDRFDLEAVHLAQVALQEQGVRETRRRFPLTDEEGAEVEKPKPATGSVIVGELIAIFPGFFVHGLGHYYAGDHRTSTRLRHVGEFGYIMTAVGGGLVVGGYFLDKDTPLQGTAYGLYASGGLIGAVGVFYLMTAWVYDMVDTPRAVRSGGRPPPSSSFVDSLDIFD